jgi:hypothetical protein
MPAQTSEFGYISRGLPQPISDGMEAEIRLSRYRDTMVMNLMPTKHPLAEEGSYFSSCNPTPGTGLAYNIQATFSDTVPFIYIFNTSLPGDPNSKRICLDFIKIIPTVAPATSTTAYYSVKTDNVARAITTNNTTAIIPANVNSDIGLASIAQVRTQTSATASAIAAASANARVVARGAFGGIPIIGDELVAMFGSPDCAPYAGLTAAQAVCPGRKVSNSPPIIIGPQQSATVHLWFVGNATTGLSYELEMGHWER